MDSINFISNNINGGKGKKDRKEKGEIEWTKPKEEKGEKKEKAKAKAVLDNKKSAGLFSFFRKDKKIVPKPPEKEVEIKSFEIKKIDRTKNEIAGRPADNIKKIEFKAPENYKIAAEKKSFFSSPISAGAKTEKIKEKKAKKHEEFAKFSSNFAPKKWESSNVLETNLIEGEVILFNQLKKDLIIIFIFIALSSLLVGVVYKGLMLWGEEKKVRVQASFEKISGINREISQTEKKLIGVPKLLDSLKIAGDLLNSHIYWSNFFEFFNDNTLADVSYSGVSFSRSESDSNLLEYSFSAKTNSFKTMISQLNLLRMNEYVKKADFSSFSPSVKEEGPVKGANSPEDQGQNEKDTVVNISAADLKKAASAEEVSFNITIALDPILFTKGPKISSIEPLTGVKGDYLTIRGINFKKQAGAGGAVKFYNKETKKIVNADADFPADCRNNWWNNSYIIAKVPELDAGKWEIIVENIDGEDRYKDEFLSANGSAGPGVCLINPNHGFGAQTVNIFGDNFGDDEKNKKVMLSADIESEIIDWSNNKITIKAPEEAVSGPLVVKGGQAKASNSFLYYQLK